MNGTSNTGNTSHRNEHVTGNAVVRFIYILFNFTFNFEREIRSCHLLITLLLDIGLLGGSYIYYINNK